MAESTMLAARRTRLSLRVRHQIARWLQRTVSFSSFGDAALARLWGPGRSTLAGVSVSEDSALNIAAYWRGVSLISGHIASMPLKVYKREQNGSRTELRQHWLTKLLQQPNPEMTGYTFREMLQGHDLTWGNGYAEIERNNADRPIALWPLTPDRVDVYRDTKIKGFPIRYRVNPSGRIVEPRDVLHIPGLAFDGLVGYSVIGRARQSLGLTMAAEQYGATFFGNGATFGGVLTSPEELDETQEAEKRAAVAQLHEGPSRAHRFLLLSGGWKYERMAIPPNDAQFLETRKMGVVEIARWLGIPPHMLFELDRATFNNIENQGLDYYRNTLWSWCERWEQAIWWKLINPLEQNSTYVEFNIDGVLRADIKTRYEAYQIGRNIGLLSVNDICDLENMNHVPGGDIRLAPLNNVPLEKFSEYTDKKINQPKPQIGQPGKGGTNDETDKLKQQAKDATDKADRAEAAAAESRRFADEKQAELDAVKGQQTITLTEVAALVKERDAARALAAEQQHLADTFRKDAERLEQAFNTEESKRKEETTRADEAVTLAGATRADRDRIELERLALQERFDRAVAQLRTATDTLEQRQHDVLSAKASEQRIDRQLTAVASDLTAARATLAEKESMVSRLIDESAQHGIRADASDAERDTARAEVDRLTAELARVDGERQTATARVTELELAAIDKGREIVDARMARQAAEADRDSVRAIVDDITRDRDAARTELADAITRTRELHDRETERTGAILDGHRVLIVNVMRKMIEYEISCLRQRQRSKEKLQKWAEMFYPGHEDLCVRELLPIVRLHVDFIGSTDDPEALTRRLVREHIEGSKRDLVTVIEGDDEAITGSVYDLQQRWLRDRVDVIANRLLQQAIDVVRKRQA